MAGGREWRWRDDSYCGDEDCQFVTLRYFPGNLLSSLFVVEDGGSMTSEATNGHHVPPVASAPTVVENTELNRDDWISGEN